MKLQNKVAVITGAGSGMGKEMALLFGIEGAKLVLADISQTSIDQVVAEVKQNGGNAVGVIANVAKEEDVQNMIDTAVNTFGSLDVLVNNAGVAPKIRADLLEMSEESYDYVMNTNAKAVMFLSQLAAKAMLSQPVEGTKRGTIINIGSCSAEVSSVNRGEYCVSKAGLSMLTKLYADRLAGEGVFVHEIRPGIIRSDMTAGVGEKYDRLIGEGIFPIKRWGKPEDVAGAVSVFAGDSFLYTTGNFVDVDGGFHIRRL
jgi:NAD(P)-dependent dehydrogenase (short-subunit alcohol dehydrogenase family)